MSKSKELKKLEKTFKEYGYSNQMINDIKHYDNEYTIGGYIANLEEELSCWGW